MQQRKKANSVITHSMAGSIITFNVGEQSFTFDVGNVTSEIGMSAMIHGIIQKISDRAAIARDPETGASATPEEKFEAMRECGERLQSGGPWNSVREGGQSTGGILYRAMSRLYPDAWTDRKAFAAFLEAKSADESAKQGKPISVADVRAGLMAVKKVAKMVSTIRDEAAKSSPIDGGGILQELESAQ